MDRTTRRVWFVTGASRGFGAEIAAAALEAGDAVVGKVEGFDAMEEVGIGVALPSGLDAGEELPPHLMIFFRI